MENSREIWRQSEEREVRISDILWKIVESWRLVLVLAVVFVLLVTGIFYLRAIKAASVPVEPVEPEEEEVLTEEESQEVVQVQIGQAQLLEQREYQKKSVLMNINAYEKNVVTLEYFIDSTPTESGNGDILTNTYRNYITSNRIVEDIREEWNSPLNDGYIGELIECTNSDMNIKMGFLYDEDQLSKLKRSSDKYFVVSVTGADASQAEQLADAVQKALEIYSARIAQQLGEQQLKPLNRYSSVVLDEKLIDKQLNLQTSINVQQDAIDNATEGFSELQLRMLYGEDEDQEEPVIEEQMPRRPALSKKAMALGLFTGVFLACIWVALRYMFDPRIKSSEELRRIYNMRVLGFRQIEGTSRKRLFSGIDTWIASKKDRDKFTPESLSNMLVTNMALLLKRENISRVFLASGSVDEGTMEEINEIIGQLKGEGIEAVYESNIISDAAALKCMSDIGNAVFVVRENLTHYQEMEKALLLCEAQEVRVLGGIVVQ